MMKIISCSSNGDALGERLPPDLVQEAFDALIENVTVGDSHF